MRLSSSKAGEVIKTREKKNETSLTLKAHVTTNCTRAHTPLPLFSRAFLIFVFYLFLRLCVHNGKVSLILTQESKRGYTIFPHTHTSKQTKNKKGTTVFLFTRAIHQAHKQRLVTHPTKCCEWPLFSFKVTFSFQSTCECVWVSARVYTLQSLCLSLSLAAFFCFVCSLLVVTEVLQKTGSLLFLCCFLFLHTTY